MYRVLQAKDDAQLERYYHFRWSILNKPMQQPLGSERDAYDPHSLHLMLETHESELVAVGRIYINDSSEALIKFLAVEPLQRGQGLGLALLMALEKTARDEQIERLVLNARGDAIDFFKKCGFKVAGAEVFDKEKLTQMQMVKDLDDRTLFVRQPELCRQLQLLYKSQIPASDRIGLRLTRYTNDLLETRLPYGGNTNNHQTMFAGCSYSQAVLSGWGMAWLMTRERGLNVDIILIKGEIIHRQPIIQDSVARIENKSFKRRIAALQEGKRLRIKVHVDIYCDTTLAAEFEGVYMLVPSHRGGD